MKTKFIDELLPQLALWLALLLAALVLTGCANLGQMFQPPDPTIVRAENTAAISEISVNSFLKLQKANPDESNLDAAHLARSLEERFPQDLATLRGLLEAYKQTKSPYAKSALLPAIDSVKSSGDVAHMQLAEQPPIRNRFDTFAPPMPQPTPLDELRMIAVSNSTQIEQLTTNMTELNRKLTLLLAIQRRADAGTNSVPPPPIPQTPTNTPAIPPRL